VATGAGRGGEERFVRCFRGFVFERGFAETGRFLAAGFFFLTDDGALLFVFICCRRVHE
jgi:hypothetical protein